MPAAKACQWKLTGQASTLPHAVLMVCDSAPRMEGAMAGVWMRLAAAGMVLASGGSVWAQDAQTPVDDIAVQLRSQGYACENPRDAAPDPSATKADERAWTIQCDGQKYRVRF